MKESKHKFHKKPDRRQNLCYNINGQSDAEVLSFQREYEAKFSPPPFTYAELKEAIPPYLFERSTLKSSAYLIVNLSTCAVIFYLATFIDTFSHQTARVFGWILYWIFEGIAAGGLWVLAHDCGHQAFSPTPIVNHVIGFILHTILLVPYHSWRISHLQHHAGRAHIDREPTFSPKRRNPNESSSPWIEAIEDSPLYTLGKVILFLSVGWPAYLLANASGQQYDRFTSHLLPSSPIFKESQRNQILISDAGLVIVLIILGYFATLTSIVCVVKFYVVPYLIVNAFLVFVTLLQHTDVFLPIYSDESWTFVRGALATVDRDYGWFLNTAFHHINDSHVVHHLFAQIPHYNAILATKYLRIKLGNYYIVDKTPAWKALWRIVRNCVVVENSGNVLFYRRR